MGGGEVWSKMPKRTSRGVPHSGTWILDPLKSQTYQAGARFAALDEGVIAAASKSTGYFFAISISQKVRCRLWKQ